MIKKLLYHMHVVKKLERWLVWNGSISFGGAFAVWRKRILRYFVLEYVRHYNSKMRVIGEALCVRIGRKRFLLCYG